MQSRELLPGARQRKIGPRVVSSSVLARGTEHRPVGRYRPGTGGREERGGYTGSVDFGEWGLRTRDMVPARSMEQPYSRRPTWQRSPGWIGTVPVGSSTVGEGTYHREIDLSLDGFAGPSRVHQSGEHPLLSVLLVKSRTASCGRTEALHTDCCQSVPARPQDGRFAPVNRYSRPYQTLLLSGTHHPIPVLQTVIDRADGTREGQWREHREETGDPPRHRGNCTANGTENSSPSSSDDGGSSPTSSRVGARGELGPVHRV